MRIALAGLIILVGGCALTDLRQDVVAAARDRTEKAGAEIVVAAQAVESIAVEMSAAVTEDRAPALTPIFTRVTDALTNACAYLNETGNALAALQEDFGVSPRTVPDTPEELAALITRYRAVAKAFQMAVRWFKATIGGRALGVVGGGGATVAGWTPTEIGGLVTMILAAVGGAEELVRRKFKKGKPKKGR